jgi:hypothetical protein
MKSYMRPSWFRKVLLETVMVQVRSYIGHEVHEEDNEASIGHKKEVDACISQVKTADAIMG